MCPTSSIIMLVVLVGLLVVLVGLLVVLVGLLVIYYILNVASGMQVAILYK